jgi:hypothetical protein
LGWSTLGGQVGVTHFDFWLARETISPAEPRSVVGQTTSRSDTDPETIANRQTSDVAPDAEAQQGQRCWQEHNCGWQ